MKTGIIRRIDDLGRVVIPRDIREKLNINIGDALELSIEDNKVVFERYLPAVDLENNILRLIQTITDYEELTEKELQVISLLKEACLILKENK